MQNRMLQEIVLVQPKKILLLNGVSTHSVGTGKPMKNSEQECDNKTALYKNEFHSYG
jgi:hypothetical protein